MEKKVGFAIAILVGALLAVVLWSDLFAGGPAAETVARPAVVPAAPPVVPAPVVRAPAPVLAAPPTPVAPSDHTSEPREVTTRGPNGETIVVTSDGTVMSTTVTRSPDGAN